MGIKTSRVKSGSAKAFDGPMECRRLAGQLGIRLSRQKKLITSTKYTIRERNIWDPNHLSKLPYRIHIYADVCGILPNLNSAHRSRSTYENCLISRTLGRIKRGPILAENSTRIPNGLIPNYLRHSNEKQQ